MYEIVEKKFIMNLKLRILVLTFLFTNYNFLINANSFSDQNTNLFFVYPPEFTMERGFYYDAFSVIITTKAKDGVIIYTLDGSLPTFENGIVYSEPVNIKTTTPLRAVVFDAYITQA